MTVLATELERQAKAAQVDIAIARALMAQCEELIKLSYDKIVSADELLAEIRRVTIRDTACSVDEVDW